MKAIVQHTYGSPDKILQLRDIDKPIAGDDEVLVRVRAASIHPDVWHTLVATGTRYLAAKNRAGISRYQN